MSRARFLIVPIVVLTPAVLATALHGGPPAQPGAAPALAPAPAVVTEAPVGPPRGRVFRGKPIGKPPTFVAAPVRDPFAPRGTTVLPHKDAQGVDLTLQQTIAAVLSRRDQPTPERIAHFAWLGSPHWSGRVKMVGWHGNITEASQTADGWTATVHFRPALGPGAVAFTPDHVIETYRYSRGKLELVKIVHPAGTFQTVIGD
jgi:hypothetical protein